MMFFIDEPTTYASVNNKGREMNEWISTFTHVLIPDELSRDAFIEGVRMKAAMLDKKYPRTKPLHISFVSHLANWIRLEVYPEHDPNKTVFFLNIYMVRGEFQFSEKPQLDKKGGLR